MSLHLFACTLCCILKGSVWTTLQLGTHDYCLSSSQEALISCMLTHYWTHILDFAQEVNDTKDTKQDANWGWSAARLTPPWLTHFGLFQKIALSSLSLEKFQQSSTDGSDYATVSCVSRTDSNCKFYLRDIVSGNDVSYRILNLGEITII